MRTIDFTRSMNDLDGKPLLDGEVPVTLAVVACNSLLGTFKDEPNLSGADKVKRFALAMRINRKSVVDDLTAEDVALLKALIGKAYAALVVGQAWQMLDPSAGEE